METPPSVSQGDPAATIRRQVDAAIAASLALADLVATLHRKVETLSAEVSAMRARAPRPPPPPPRRIGTRNLELTYPCGTVRRFDDDGNLHSCAVTRDGGTVYLPAVNFPDGRCEWWVHGVHIHVPA